VLAWPLPIARRGLAGLPATAGFFGKIFLIDAAVSNGWAWLGVAIVIGSAISLAYYLRVVAAVWMRAPGEQLAGGRLATTPRPAIAGGATDAGVASEPAGDVPASGGFRSRQPEVVVLAILCALLTVAAGLYPDPLFDVARDAGDALQNLL
jgi:NADH-quinone oxidoreductase subunit N